jgi:hypothetical protein
LKFLVLPAVTMNTRAFWDVLQCSFIGVETDVSGVRTASIIRVTNGFITLMMEVIRTSETSVYSETTRHYIPECSHLPLLKIQQTSSSTILHGNECSNLTK